jgi:hypothetical protein
LNIPGPRLVAPKMSSERGLVLKSKKRAHSKVVPYACRKTPAARLTRKRSSFCEQIGEGGWVTAREGPGALLHVLGAWII